MDREDIWRGQSEKGRGVSMEMGERMGGGGYRERGERRGEGWKRF